jgi:hypothetical protein
VEADESLPAPPTETTVPMPTPAETPRLPSAIEGEKERGIEERTEAEAEVETESELEESSPAEKPPPSVEIQNKSQREERET